MYILIIYHELLYKPLQSRHQVAYDDEVEMSVKQLEHNNVMEISLVTLHVPYLKSIILEHCKVLSITVVKGHIIICTWECQSQYENN